jgi:hypothetical protein
MHAGDPEAVRSWTARHGAVLRELVSAHAEFVDAVAGGMPRTGSDQAGDDGITGVAARLLDAGRTVAALPAVPDEQARDLIDRLLQELRATLEAGTFDPVALRASALRSSLVVVDLLDRLLQPG